VILKTCPGEDDLDPVPRLLHATDSRAAFRHACQKLNSTLTSSSAMAAHKVQHMRKKLEHFLNCCLGVIVCILNKVKALSF
jgi:hypothetical protein